MKNSIPPILYSRHHGSCENDSLPQQQVQQIKENMTTPADNGKCRFMGQVRKSEVTKTDAEINDRKPKVEFSFKLALQLKPCPYVTP